MSPGTEVETWRAPYVSYATLINFIDTKLGAGNPLPPRIDRGFLDNYAGSIQAQLVSTLRTMGMIGDAGEVLPPLREATASPDARQAVIRRWAEGFYQDQLALAHNNATASMLHESFARRKYTGSTLRKAVVFYLSLVDDVGLPTSSYFKAPRQSPPGGRPRRKREAPSPSPEPPTPPYVGSQPDVVGERKVVGLGEAGTVTVLVDVRWLDLPDATFTKLRQAIKDLEALGTPAATSPTSTEEAAS